ncbi:Hypothetical protein LUCI_1478 [Lucifera butyrica]|uniref:siroheme decarboxylase n=1 Tax=Lucifera butyrica TaxID=1351585 RepID=A0A498R539_9FIRM|nr:AsnC family transcriptional regulator [Lucifera butyrica]VBB06259.1 Hypothetical protein LUCI_1478 [Lucifera butyrica]
MDEMDKKIVIAMQDDFPLCADPYQQIAAKIGIGEEELLRRLKRQFAEGKIRKMGAVLQHREVGFAANALCVWVVPEERLEEVGRSMAACSAVTHCYSRIPVPEWPYNFYVMIHARTRKECEAMVAELSRKTGLDNYDMLFSTREWKKTSMRYFREVGKNA